VTPMERGSRLGTTHPFQTLTRCYKGRQSKRGGDSGDDRLVQGKERGDGIELLNYAAFGPHAKDSNCSPRCLL